MNAISPSVASIQADMGIPMSDLVPSVRTSHSDATILGLREEFRAAVAGMVEVDRNDDVSDEEMDSAANRFNAVCRAIADSPPAQTQAGRALKAAAAKQQLRGEYGLEVKDDWPSPAHEVVWHILTEFAGDEYFPSADARWEPPQRIVSSNGATA